MNILLEKINDFETDIDQEIFDKILDFIFSIEIEKLSDIQLDDLADIVNKLEQAGESIDELKHAQKTPATIKSYAKSWYRKNKISITGRKAKLARSAKKRKEMRQKDRMEKAGKSPSGRKRLLYNVVRKK